MLVQNKQYNIPLQYAENYLAMIEMRFLDCIGSKLLEIIPFGVLLSFVQEY